MTSAINVPFVDLSRQFRSLEAPLVQAFVEVGNSGVYILGPQLERFEREVASICGVKHAVGVADGSAALFLSLKALDVGPGDEVITAANSFIASAWVIVATGATPILTDVGPDLNMDPESLERAVNGRTKAIIPVHLAGRPAAMNEIMRIAQVRGIHIVEDAAQAIGAKYYGMPVGSFGIAGAFSLHPLKNLGIYGDGGFITTNDDALADRVRLLRNHGLRTRDDCEVWGFNSRLDTIQAAFALVKLQYLEKWNVRNREIASMYRSELCEIVDVPKDQPYESNVYHNFILNSPLRDKLARYLKDRGIGTAVHYPTPIHLQRAAIDLPYGPGSFPRAESFARTMLSLPIYPELENSEVLYVVEQIQRFFREKSESFVR